MDISKINNITNLIILLQEDNKINEAANLYIKTVNELKKDPILGSDLEWINNLIYPETYDRLKNMII